MTTSQTTNLHLTKAVKGTAEPFSIDAVNANLDTIDAKVGAVGNTDLQSQVTALGESVTWSFIGYPDSSSHSAWLALGNGFRYVFGSQADSLGLPAGGVLVQFIPYNNQNSMAQLLIATDHVYTRRAVDGVFQNWLTVK